MEWLIIIQIMVARAPSVKKILSEKDVAKSLIAKEPMLINPLFQIGNCLFPEVTDNHERLVASATAIFDTAFNSNLQRRLNIEVTGVYSASTKVAVMQVQLENGLLPTGWAGPEVMEILGTDGTER